MDIAQFDLESAAERGVLVKLLHPATGRPMLDEDKVELAIRIAGMDSKRWRDASLKQKTNIDVTKKIESMTDPAFDETIREVLAESTLELIGKWEWDGVPMKACRDDVIKVLSREGFAWLVEELLAAAGNRKLLFFAVPNG